ncbi:MAG: hypothetical protein RIQ70_62 [Bacteroidota bacterium]|jgi:peptidoglycan/xylan/chitin deacetylase (PgdA/CDA1 family)
MTIKSIFPFLIILGAIHGTLAHTFLKETITTKNEFWIDRFSEIDAKSFLGATCFTATGVGNGGIFSPVRQKISDKNQYLNCSFSVNKGEYKWAPYVMLGLPMVMNLLPVTFHPIALAYDFRGSQHNVQLQFTEALDNVRLLGNLPTSPSALNRKADETIPVIFQEIVKKVEQVEEKTSIPKEVLVADWQGFAKAAYSLTFDDGLMSHYSNVAPILEKHKLQATFFVVSDMLQENQQAKPSWRYGYWEQFKLLQEQGHEIGGHTCTHTHLGSCPLGDAKEVGTLSYEIQQPFATITKNIPDAMVTSFAYPFGEYNDKVITEVGQFYLVARGVKPGINQPKSMDWMDIRCNAMHYSPQRTLETDKEKFIELQHNIVQNTIASGGWSVYLAHDVVPFEEAVNLKDSWQPVSAESLDSFAVWLNQQQKQNQLWVAPFGTVAKYIKEKNNLKVTYALASNFIELQVTDNLIDTQFNVPITLEIDVPAEWTKIAVMQNGEKVKPISINNGKLRLNAVPDKGLILISNL